MKGRQAPSKSLMFLKYIILYVQYQVNRFKIKLIKTCTFNLFVIPCMYMKEISYNKKGNTQLGVLGTIPNILEMYRLYRWYYFYEQDDNYNDEKLNDKAEFFF